MSGARVPFDPSLPAIVGCQDLACGPLKFTRGQQLPWRDLGVSERDLAEMYDANQVDFEAPNMVAPPAVTLDAGVAIGGGDIAFDAEAVAEAAPAPRSRPKKR